MRQRKIRIDNNLFIARVAKTDVDRATGFMFRTKLDPREAMLFVFPGCEQQSIWMKNCEVALDIASIGNDGIVLETTSLPPEITGTKRLQTIPSFKFTRPSKVILEVKRGTFLNLGIKPGSKLLLT
jgi:uncharacterized membrane protein (UPF0127 family)